MGTVKRMEWIIPREELERQPLTAGLEVHQQLRGRKLHSAKPVRQAREEEPYVFIHRRLHTTTSELGETDTAAKREAQRGREYVYAYYPSTSSLVEADEEPPLPPSGDALQAGVAFARMIGARVLRESVVMRKIVVDGSNTSGFQRTMLIALNGELRLKEGRVGIGTVTLEEDAASIIRQDEGRITYDLSRLGVPLIEIATRPDLKTARMVREAALMLGTLLRRLPQARRGLGTIRQDVNVSIPGGARVEIKGVQDVETIDLLVLKEVERQLRLQAWREAYGRIEIGPVKRVTEVFTKTGSKRVADALARGRDVWILPITHGRGMFSFMLTHGLWMGRELAGFLKRETRLKGFFQSDELPAYGISQGEVEAVRTAARLDRGDAFILIIAPEGEAREAFTLLTQRINHYLRGVPSEVRKAEEDLTTSYLRPMPGSARMYPETDLEPVIIPQDVEVPPSLGEWEDWFSEHGLREEEARQAARSEWRALLKRLVKAKGREGFLFLTEDVTRITREKNILFEHDSLQPDGRISPAFEREQILEEALSILTEWGRQAAAGYVEKRLEGIPPGEARNAVRPFTSDEEAREAIRRLISSLPSNVHPGKALGMIMEHVKGRYDAKRLISMIREGLSRERNA